MIRTTFLLALTSALHAAPPEAFWRALHQVETSGRTGAIRGDNGKALGPLQIHRGYHADSRVPGDYSRCADLAYSIKVASAYLRRYAPQAWVAGDTTTLARVHNGGPAGARKAATLPYAAKVRAAMGGAR
ncbi:MAG: hypothetical protein FJ184_02050 [Gammaproteobacteria bacterium]|nr:hypothetical protein [Gammaproteobacteria bacterium]